MFVRILLYSNTLEWRIILLYSMEVLLKYILKRNYTKLPWAIPQKCLEYLIDHHWRPGYSTTQSIYTGVMLHWAVFWGETEASGDFLWWGCCPAAGTQNSQVLAWQSWLNENDMEATISHLPLHKMDTFSTYRSAYYYWLFHLLSLGDFPIREF